MNQPDRYERFVLTEGQQKVRYDKDTKLANAGTFTIQREDHTMGNLIRMQLHERPSIVFAGYRIPHPLKAEMVVKLQTRGQQPDLQLIDTLEDIKQEFLGMKSQAMDEFSRVLNDQSRSYMMPGGMTPRR